MEVHQRLLEAHPEFRIVQGDLERTTRSRLRRAIGVRLRPSVIQVVVHVLYNVASENISDKQVISQIDALNRDYGAGNEDRETTPTVWRGLVTESGIRFSLASVDPSGQPSSGITRTKTKTRSFSTNNDCKIDGRGGKSPWPTDNYLNIWVCSLGGGILGYAQFPGGPPDTDGVVILNTAFGTTGTVATPFDLGRTAVHEVGHWLNLHHIWGDTSDCSGNDFVDDTPNAQHPNYGTPAFPHISCSNGPSGDMFVNFMDYVDDKAMVMFTAGQVERMQATLDGPRSTLLNAQPAEVAAKEK